MGLMGPCGGRIGAGHVVITKTYDVRCYFKDDHTPSRIVETGLSREQAEAICQDPDNNSKTTTTSEGKAVTRKYGEWFFGFTETP